MFDETFIRKISLLMSAGQVLKPGLSLLSINVPMFGLSFAGSGKWTMICQDDAFQSGDGVLATSPIDTRSQTASIRIASKRGIMAHLSINPSSSNPVLFNGVLFALDCARISTPEIRDSVLAGALHLPSDEMF